MNFFLLVFKISLDFNLNAGYKSSRFFKNLLEKSFEFVLSEKDNTVIFNMDFLLLSVKVDLIPKKQGCKKNTLGACNTGYIKIVFTLPKKVIALYVRAIIVEVRILDLKDPISECKVCFAIFLALNKKF